MQSPDPAMRAILGAISRGVPLYNSGDIEGCATLYLDIANAVISSGSLTDLSALELSSIVASPALTAMDRAWALRHAFDRFLGDIAFSQRLEAPLPFGFPGPDRAGCVVEKSYPLYRAAVAGGGTGTFGVLFRHISQKGIAMTAPVVSRLGAGAGAGAGADAVNMAFCYQSPTLGAPAAPANGVEVIDVPPMRVLSVGVRGGGGGGGGDPPLALARETLEARLALGDLIATKHWRTLGYNSPMVPPSERFWEVQVVLA